MIIWITGNSGSGKTTLAKKLIEGRNMILLDGDDMRRTISNDLGFSRKDRWENNLRIAKLAKLLENQGYDIMVSVICPYEELRREVKGITNCAFLYLEGGELRGEEYPYEVPGDLFSKEDKLFYLLTVPHTGTRTTLNLLQSNSLIRVKGVEQSENFLISMLENSLIDYEKFESFLYQIHLSGESKYLCLYSHIMPEEEKHGIIWLAKLDFLKKTVIPLRDPLLASISVFLQTGDNPTALNEALDLLKIQFTLLVKYVSVNKDVFYLPIDLLSKSLSERQRRIRSLFVDFLGIFMSKQCEDFIEKFSNSYSTIETALYGHGISSEKDSYGLFSARELLRECNYKYGDNSFVDREADYYGNIGGLKEIYISNGYENLAWFR